MTISDMLSLDQFVMMQGQLAGVFAPVVVLWLVLFVAVAMVMAVVLFAIIVFERFGALNF